MVLKKRLANMEDVAVLVEYGRWNMPSQMQRWINVVRAWFGKTTPKPSAGSGTNTSSKGSKSSPGKK